MKGFFRKNRALVLFIVGITGYSLFYYYVWKVYVWETFLMRPWRYLYHISLSGLTKMSATTLDLLGYHTWIDYRYINIDGANMNILVGNSCLAIDVMVIFTGLILFYPGPWKKKLWFIPLGILGIHLINVARVVALGIVIAEFPADIYTVDHHRAFNIVAYIFIFLMFVVWTRVAGRKGGV